MPFRRRAVLGAALLALAASAAAGVRPAAPVVSLSDSTGLQRALREARLGTRIEIAPGDYRGVFAENVHGTSDLPIVLAAAQPDAPPIFRGSTEGLHLAGAEYVELRGLHFTGQSGNGLNIDDGGPEKGKPARGIVLRDLVVSDVGPTGNHDGIKLSGLDQFRIENCRVERWGVDEGNAIDMVGCHEGVIENCTFRHQADPATTGAGGIQAKGGCRAITIRRCRFENAGHRSVNIGGRTGFPFFRPSLERWPSGATGRYEAKDIRIEGCTFIGTDAPVAFVGVDGAVVRYNTFYLPNRWALRILQETTVPGFVPSRGGVFTNNLIAFRSDQWREGGVNIGPHTAPETFRFAENIWYCVDAPARSRPQLPTPETGGTYGRAPLFRAPDTGDLRLQPESFVVKRAGAEALGTRSPD